MRKIEKIMLLIGVSIFFAGCTYKFVKAENYHDKTVKGVNKSNEVGAHNE